MSCYDEDLGRGFRVYGGKFDQKSAGDNTTIIKPFLGMKTSTEPGYSGTSWKWLLLFKESYPEVTSTTRAGFTACKFSRGPYDWILLAATLWANNAIHFVLINPLDSGTGTVNLLRYGEYANIDMEPPDLFTAARNGHLHVYKDSDP